ncbi:MAG: retropepsin-like aspartic protease [Verrucomicrobiota bacterium]
MLRFLLPALASIFLFATAACTHSGRAGSTGIPWKGTAVPLSLETGIPSVQAMINHQPASLIVDSGASLSAVTESLANRLGLRKTGVVRITGFSGGASVYPTARLPSVLLGSARFDHVPVAILPDEIFGHASGSIEGILGLPLFAETRLTLDYPRRQLRLSSPGTRQPKGLPVAMRLDEGIPRIILTLNNRPVETIVDTGYGGGLAIDPSKFGIGSTPTGVNEVGSEMSGISVAPIHRLDGLILLNGTPFLSRPPVAIIPRNEPVLGSAVLQNFTVSFDQKRGLLILGQEEGI